MNSVEAGLRDFFGREAEVRLAYLFGSAARSEEGPLSDVDIAVLVDEGLDSKRRFDLKLDLIGRVCKILKTDKVDLVLLNDAPLSLSYNVIKDGLCLKSTERDRVSFEGRVLSMYLDRKYFFDRHAREALKRMSGAVS